MKKLTLLIMLYLACCGTGRGLAQDLETNDFLANYAPTSSSNRADRNLGVTRGVYVILGDIKSALDLAKKTELLIYVQLPKAEQTETARRAADAAGLYGRRVYIEQGDLKRIHLADNLADGLIATGSAVESITEAEALRVVKPFGKVIIGDKTTIKPWPAGMEDWSHPY